MKTEPLPSVYARLARKVQIPDPKYAALREVMWEPCICGVCAEQSEGIKHHAADCACYGTGLSDVRPLDTLDAGKLAEAMNKTLLVVVRMEVFCDGAEVLLIGRDITEEAPTLLEALIRAADAALESKP